jgi:imidazolonepropionase-like amidohydrolase
MKHIISIIFIVIFTFITGLSDANGESIPVKYAIKAGKILTMAPAEGSDTSGRVINHGIILVGNEKIEALGPASDINMPKDYTIIDASDRWVMPGIVEAHSHVGTEGGINDMVTLINPGLQIADYVNPEDVGIRKAVMSGVTTIHTMQGSGTNLGGFTVIIKLDSSCPEKMVFREIAAMKATQAYNPERRGGDLGLTRMGMSWTLRQILKRAKAYTEIWEEYEQGERQERPEYKPEFENMRKVFRGEIPVIVHTYQAWGVMQTIRMFNDENHLKVIATHTHGGGYMVGKEAARREGVFIDIGPQLVDFWSAADRRFIGIGAADNRFHGMGAEYHKAGVRNLSINTDAVGWGRQEELALQASMSSRFGLDDLVAMEAITINSARALGIDDRVGSLEVGKDADIVIKRGSLLEVTTPVDLVLINGKIVYKRKGTNLVAKEKQDMI